MKKNILFNTASQESKQDNATTDTEMNDTLKNLANVTKGKSRVRSYSAIAPKKTQETTTSAITQLLSVTSLVQEIPVEGIEASQPAPSTLLAPDTSSSEHLLSVEIKEGKQELPKGEIINSFESSATKEKSKEEIKGEISFIKNPARGRSISAINDIVPDQVIKLTTTVNPVITISNFITPSPTISAKINQINQLTMLRKFVKTGELSDEIEIKDQKFHRKNTSNGNLEILSGLYPFVIVYNAQDRKMDLRIGSTGHFYLALDKNKLNSVHGLTLTQLRTYPLDATYLEPNIVAAGEIQFVEGKALSWTNQSGCFFKGATHESILHAVSFFPKIFKKDNVEFYVEKEEEKKDVSSMDSSSTVTNRIN